MGLLAEIGGLKNGQPLGIGSHHAIFDAVMYHLDEMTGAARPATQVALLRCAVRLLTPRRARDVARARREGREDRIETLHCVRLAADHHAIAALKPPDAA